MFLPIFWMFLRQTDILHHIAFSASLLSRSLNLCRCPKHIREHLTNICKMINYVSYRDFEFWINNNYYLPNCLENLRASGFSLEIIEQNFDAHGRHGAIVVEMVNLEWSSDNLAKLVERFQKMRLSRDSAFESPLSFALGLEETSSDSYIFWR